MPVLGNSVMAPSVRKRRRACERTPKAPSKTRQRALGGGVRRELSLNGNHDKHPADFRHAWAAHGLTPFTEFASLIAVESCFSINRCEVPWGVIRRRNWLRCRCILRLTTLLGIEIGWSFCIHYDFTAAEFGSLTALRCLFG